MATEATPEQPKKSKKTLIIIISVVLVLILAIAAAVGFFILHQQEAYSEDGTQVEEPEKKSKKKDAEHEVSTFTEPEKFTANLADEGADRFAQVGIVFELTDPLVDPEIKSVMPIIRSRILLLLSAKTTAELHTPDGKKLFASQVLEIARQEVGAEHEEAVKAAHFSAFVIQ